MKVKVFEKIIQKIFNYLCVQLLRNFVLFFWIFNLKVASETIGGYCYINTENALKSVGFERFVKRVKVGVGDEPTSTVRKICTP